MCWLDLSSIWRVDCQWIFAGHLFSKSSPSMTKIDVAPVSAIASSVAIVRKFKYCGIGLSYTSLAASAIDVTRLGSFWLCNDTFDNTTVTSSLSITVTTLRHWVGFGELAETKLLHLCAILFSAPHHQKLVWRWGTVSCALLWCTDHTPRWSTALRFCAWSTPDG